MTEDPSKPLITDKRGKNRHLESASWVEGELPCPLCGAHPGTAHPCSLEAVEAEEQRLADFAADPEAQARALEQQAAEAVETAPPTSYRTAFTIMVRHDGSIAVQDNLTASAEPEPSYVVEEPADGKTIARSCFDVINNINAGETAMRVLTIIEQRQEAMRAAMMTRQGGGASASPPSQGRGGGAGGHRRPTRR